MDSMAYLAAAGFQFQNVSLTLKEASQEMRKVLGSTVKQRSVILLYKIAKQAFKNHEEAFFKRSCNFRRFSM